MIENVTISATLIRITFGQDKPYKKKFLKYFEDKVKSRYVYAYKTKVGYQNDDFIKNRVTFESVILPVSQTAEGLRNFRRFIAYISKNF